MDYETLSDEEVIKAYEACIPTELQHGLFVHGGYQHTAKYRDIYQSVEDLKVYNDDIWITSVPKSGTTWLSEVVWSICNDINSLEAKLPLNERVRFLEYSALFNFDTDSTAPQEVSNSVKKVADMSKPRFIKTHLPFQCLPDEIRNFSKRPRIIHIARDPKDVAVSYFHHNRNMRGFSGSQDLFYEVFVRGLIRWAPYENNVRSYWTLREEPNILFLCFEEMKNNMSSIIEKIASFLNVEVSVDKMTALLHHLSFEGMKRNEKNLAVDKIIKYINDRYLHKNKTGNFLRIGETGGHHQEMSDKMAARIDERMSYGNECK